jgi:hypothetical protein
MSKSLKKAKSKIWYGGKNSTFNAQFIQKNVLVKEVSISK